MHVIEWDFRSAAFRAAILRGDLYAVEALREAIVEAFENLRWLFEFPDAAELEWCPVMIDDWVDATREWIRQIEPRSHAI
jgi:hypothetical protein